MSEYLLSIRTADLVRSFAVGSTFELSSHPRARVWVPAPILAGAFAKRTRVPVEVRADEFGPRLVVGGRELGAEWASDAIEMSVVGLPPDLRHEATGEILGDSLAMRRLQRDLMRAASTEASVLLQGETGTGKELLARTLHEHSARRGAPYVVVDCTAISDTLFESELFGHAKGSFSGAHGHRVGPFEEADGGTIFIDEVGEIPLALQSKLLRVLESGTVRRVGENAHRKVDVRVICATHRDLHKMVLEGTFRGDLYYRLAVLELKVPPLRERYGDLALLLDHFIPEATLDELSTEHWEAVETHPWTGNIRELRNFAQRAVVHGWDGLFEFDAETSRRRRESDRPKAVTPKGVPSPKDLPQPDTTESLTAFRERWIHEGERLYLLAVLRATGGNVTHAANLAKVDRSHLHRVLRKHGIDRSEVRDD